MGATHDFPFLMQDDAYEL